MTCRCVGASKFVLPSIFDTSLSSLMMWILQSYQITVLNERMWHFKGGGRGQNILWPSYPFSGAKTPTAFQDARPWCRVNFVNSNITNLIVILRLYYCYSYTVIVIHNMCKRSLLFVKRCLQTDFTVVKHVAGYGVCHGRTKSILHANVQSCIERFGVTVDARSKIVVLVGCRRYTGWAN